MLTKTKLKEHIEKFSEKFSVDELVERLLLIEKFETGIKQYERGEVVSENDLDNEQIKKRILSFAGSFAFP